MARDTVCGRNRSRDTTSRANLTHVPRHNRSSPRLGQGSEVRVGARVRKRYVSTIKGVGGSRVDVFVVPGRCDVRSRCRSVSVSLSRTSLNVVVVVVDHFVRDFDGEKCGTWSGVLC